METTQQPRFSLKACYSKAWKAFAKWWIPICLFAGVLMVFQLGPRQLAKAESSALGQTLKNIISAFEQDDLGRVEELVIELNEALMAYAKKLMAFMLYALPFVALSTILLLCTSLMAVEGRRRRFPPGRIVGVALANLVLALNKVSLVFLLPPLGLFIYIKLCLVTLLMLEQGLSPAEAIKASWRMTAGSFWPLFGMSAINGALQLAVAPTIIGLIRAAGFASTARAAAYSMLRGIERTGYVAGISSPTLRGAR